MVITEDTTLAPGAYDFPTGAGITIAASDITLNGNGAILRGPGHNKYAGTGVRAEGMSGVRVTGLSVAGFELAMHVTSGDHWMISDNDFTGNYTDPDYGWGDGKLVGALLLERVHHSTIAHNVAHQNWNGLALHYSDDNVVRDNDFSHCTNVCLKLWSASGNTIVNNNFSHGIRVAFGETHARDSTSALLESGSNHNRVIGNDFTHGGDGVFIRSLNGVVSTGNYFEGNDASYAHNNAWESWSPGNTYVRNKGNHSSYGFWLGNSDDTVLIDNEAAYNGQRSANAPESFGNAGIAVVNGSSSHFVLDGNDIHDNTSVGVALGNRADYPAYHWIIQRNRIVDNTTYGIYVRDSRWISVGANEIEGNGSGAIECGDNTSGMFWLTGESVQAPVVRIESAEVVRAGELVTFAASSVRDDLGYRWEFGDGDVATGAVVRHRFRHPGFYRLGLTADDGGIAGMAHRDVYVLGSGRQIGTDPNRWTGGSIELDPGRSVAGGGSMRFSGGTGDAVWRYTSELDVRDQETLSFWLHSEQESRDGFVGNQPVVRLTDADGGYVQLAPNRNYLDPWTFPYQEARVGWQLIAVPLAGGCNWERAVSGAPRLDAVRSIELRTSAIGGPYRIWLDQMTLTG